MARRTFRYSSTVKMPPPSLLQKGHKWQSFTPPAAGLSRRYRGRLFHRRSQRSRAALPSCRADRYENDRVPTAYCASPCSPRSAHRRPPGRRQSTQPATPSKTSTPDVVSHLMTGAVNVSQRAESRHRAAPASRCSQETIWPATRDPCRHHEIHQQVMRIGGQHHHRRADPGEVRRRGWCRQGRCV